MLQETGQIRKTCFSESNYLVCPFEAEMQATKNGFPLGEKCGEKCIFLIVLGSKD